MLQSQEGKTTPVKKFFDEQWKLYQKTINQNYMYHRQFYETLHRSLNKRFCSETWIQSG